MSSLDLFILSFFVLRLTALAELVSVGFYFLWPGGLISFLIGAVGSILALFCFGRKQGSGRRQSQKTEEDLKQKVDRFHAFVENMPGFAWIKDRDGRYVYMTESCARVTLFPDDWLGRTDDELFRADMAVVYRANDLKVITSGKSVQIIESYLLNDSQRFVMVSKFPIFDQSGNVAWVGGTSVEIIERLESDKALRSSYEQLRALSDRLQTVREEETTRIARELHDELGSALTNVKWELETIRKDLLDPPKTKSSRT
jgi:signal transduction histidine kinase